MKVLHTIGSLNPELGGVASCSYALYRGLSRKIDLEAAAFQSKKKYGDDSYIHYLTRDTVSPWAYSSSFSRFCKSLSAQSYDLYHTNGMWQYLNWKSCATAEKLGRPYVISPHGMLYPQALAHHSIRKKMMLQLCFTRLLNQAACLHATCEEEKRHLRALGLTSPIAVIPNAVMVPEDVFSITPSREVKRIGYLGRLHERKNVHWLLSIWQRIQRDNAELWIMGTGDPLYEKSLKDLSAKLKLKNVFFKGFVAGREKFEALASLNALVVPSFFENFGMIVPEALAAGTPVITTMGAPWSTLPERQCGWWVDAAEESIQKAMEEALQLSSPDISAMGKRGRELVLASFTEDAVAAKMAALYRWLLHQGEQPDFMDIIEK